MIKKINKLIILTLYIMCILCLISCDVKKIFINDSKIESSSGFYAKNMINNNQSYRVAGVATMDLAEESYTEAEIINVTNRKIIKNYSISGETKEFDHLYETLNLIIKKLDAAIDDQTIDNLNYNSTQKQRFLNMTVRVPVNNAEEFLQFLLNNTNVLSRNERQDDVTDNYNDSLLRITTLKQEQSRLNELLKKGNTVDELVKIENRLSEIGYEIQKIERRIANFDKKIDYSTFYVNISEVLLYTEPKEKIPTKDDLIIRFYENLENCKIFIINLAIYIFTHAPAIVLCLTFIMIMLLILNFALSKSKKRKNNAMHKNLVIHNQKNNYQKSDNDNLEKNEIKIKKMETNNKIDNVNNKTNSSNSVNIKHEVPQSTHYGDVQIRVMSDSDIEHDKKVKAYEDEMYHNEKNDVSSQNTNNQSVQNNNKLNKEITDIKTLLEQNTDEE